MIEKSERMLDRHGLRRNLLAKGLPFIQPFQSRRYHNREKWPRGDVPFDAKGMVRRCSYREMEVEMMHVILSRGLGCSAGLREGYEEVV